MIERGLLERLARGGERGPSAMRDPHGAMESVIHNLRRLFNARQGCSETRPDLGMPDFTDSAQGFSNALPEIIRAIKFQVEQFEPRLKNVQVRHDSDNDEIQTIRFSIRADLVLADSETPIRFSGVLGDGGHIDVHA